MRLKFRGQRRRPHLSSLLSSCKVSQPMGSVLQWTLSTPYLHGFASPPATDAGQFFPLYMAPLHLQKRKRIPPVSAGAGEIPMHM